MKRPALLALLVFSVACAREGYVLESENTTARPPVSSAETERMCAEAFIELKGAKPKMTKQEIHALVARQYGVAAADAIDTSVGKHIVLRDGALFLYTAALCKISGLPARCQQACQAAEDIGTAK